jgi:hypothetical protein
METREQIKEQIMERLQKESRLKPMSTSNLMIINRLVDEQGLTHGYQANITLDIIKNCLDVAEKAEYKFCSFYSKFIIKKKILTSGRLYL